MPQKPRKKMPIEIRAKQFMPFAALTGLDEALKKAEEEIAEEEAEGTVHAEKYAKHLPEDAALHP